MIARMADRLFAWILWRGVAARNARVEREERAAQRPAHVAKMIASRFKLASEARARGDEESARLHERAAERLRDPVWH